MLVSRSRTVGSLAIVLTLALLFGSSAVLAPEVQAVASISTLSSVSGEVLIRSGSEEFVAARVGQVLIAGDTVRTNPGARAEITYFEGSTVRLEPATEVVIEALASTSDGGSVVAVWQVAGRTWHVVTKLITGGSRYEVRTPSSTASVRGTVFAVDVGVDASGPTATVTTSEGMVLHVADALGAVRVGAGEQSIAFAGRPVQPARAAPASTLREAPARPDRTPGAGARVAPERGARTDKSTVEGPRANAKDVDRARPKKAEAPRTP